MPPSLRPVLSQRGNADAAHTKASLARHRALFANFFHRELFSRYLGSISGLAWAFVHPLALLAVYHFVFTTIFRAGSMDGKSFLLFVAVALWPWLAAQEALQRGTVSIASYAGLIRKVAFRHELVVYASVAATLALQFAGYLVVLVVLALFGEPVHFEGLLLAVPLWLVLAIAVTGLALALAALQVFVKDVEHILMPVLMILMYLTPILYPLSLVPDSMKPWVAANPFGYLVGRLRDALLDGRLGLVWGDALASSSRWRCRRGGSMGIPATVAAFRRFLCSAECGGPDADVRLAPPLRVGKDYAKLDANAGRLRLVFDLLRGRGAPQVFQALDEVSFDLAAGGSLGIIGGTAPASRPLQDRRGRDHCRRAVLSAAGASGRCWSSAPAFIPSIRASPTSISRRRCSASRAPRSRPSATRSSPSPTLASTYTIRSSTTRPEWSCGSDSPWRPR
jgi:ABC-type polysaccharide/polyol phosphate export permease